MTFRSRPIITLALASAFVAGAARAQRGDDDAVRSAEDAFGATVGRESIGLYSPDDVRGFSAVTAGNLRIDSLYFDQQSAPTVHLVAGATMRVGLAAQGFAFPAPTGIVDYQFRRPGGTRVLSLVAGGSSWGAHNLELDAQTPVTPDLSVGLGAGFYRDVFGDATRADYSQVALIARWRPRAGVEITPFFEWAPQIYNPAQPTYLTVDGGPPAWLPHIYRGPSWDAYRGANENAGLVGSVALSPDTALRAGAFHSSGTSRSTFADLLLRLTPDGRADRVIIADPPRGYVSDSGELRLARGFAEGPRRHLLIASLRARRAESLYGGSAATDFGLTRIDAPGPISQPPVVFGARTDDRVSQWFAGLAYSVAWRGLGEASLGVTHTDYRKRVATPGSPMVSAKDAPMLWNASLAIDLGPSLVVYAAHTLGLEESGQAPDVAINRNSLTPAIRTEQTDAGLRWKPAKSLSLVAGVFEVKKPYDAVDGAGYFRRLGALRNCGVEMSLIGQPTSAWTVVMGAVLLDSAVSGNAVQDGLIGRRPVGSTPAKVQLNAEYSPAGAANWSFDTGVNWRDVVVANTDGQAHLPPRATLDIGARYRFKVAGAVSVLRMQVTNVADAGGYVILGPGAYKLADGRKAIIALTTDF